MIMPNYSIFSHSAK